MTDPTPDLVERLNAWIDALAPSDEGYDECVDAVNEIERLQKRSDYYQRKLRSYVEEIERLKQLVRDLDTQIERMGVILNKHVPNWMSY